MAQQAQERIVKEHIKPRNGRQNWREYDNNAGNKKVDREPPHMFPSLALKHALKFCLSVCVHNVASGRCHRLQNTLNGINLVFQPQVVVVYRANPAAYPRYDAVATSSDPFDSLSN